MARPPESAELRQARQELARAQARVNEIQSQEWEKRGGMGWPQTLPFAFHGFLIGQGVGSLIGYVLQRNMVQRYVLFPTPQLLLMLLAAAFAAWFLRFVARQPGVRDELAKSPNSFGNMKRAAWTGFMVGLPLGLLFYLVLM